METLTETNATKTTLSGLKADDTKKPVNATVSSDILGKPSATDLAQLYCSWPESALRHEDMLESARVQLCKYDLEQDELDRVAPVLAKTLHMLVEQNGGKPLTDERKLEIERQTLEWCGCRI